MVSAPQIFSLFSSFKRTIQGTNTVKFEFPIQIQTLDTLFPTGFPTRVPLLKMDIQGKECAAIVGARGLLRGGVVRAMFFEVCASCLSDQGCSEAELLNSVLDLGFEFNKPCAGRRCGRTGYDITAFYPHPGEGERPCTRYNVANVHHPSNKYRTGAIEVPCNSTQAG